MEHEFTLTDEHRKQLSDAVDVGAMTLDEHRPLWYNTVKGAMTEGLFDMTRWERCMVGTLEMFRLQNGEDVIAFNGLVISQHEASDYGFDLPNHIIDSYQETYGYPYADTFEAHWDYLDELWRVKVDERITYDNLPRWRKWFARKP